MILYLFTEYIVFLLLSQCMPFFCFEWNNRFNTFCRQQFSVLWWQDISKYLWLIMYFKYIFLYRKVWFWFFYCTKLKYESHPSYLKCLSLYVVNGICQEGMAELRIETTHFTTHITTLKINLKWGIRFGS